MVQMIELLRYRLCAAFISGDQTFNAEGHVREPSGRVEPRSYHVSEIVRRRAPEISAAGPEKRGGARLHAACADSLESLVHEDPVIGIEAYDVGHGAQGDQVEQGGEI